MPADLVRIAKTTQSQDYAPTDWSSSRFGALAELSTNTKGRVGEAWARSFLIERGHTVKNASSRSYDLDVDGERVEVKLSCGYLNVRQKKNRALSPDVAYYWGIGGLEAGTFDVLMAVLVNPQRFIVVEIPEAEVAPRITKGRIGIAASPKDPYNVAGWISPFITYTEEAS